MMIFWNYVFHIAVEFFLTDMCIYIELFFAYVFLE
jgi:hypothetical protein